VAIDRSPEPRIGFGAPTVANPTTVSTWPFGGRPRPATVVIRKHDGGKIGT
jgi:secreted PhoX family phosphatase